MGGKFGKADPYVKMTLGKQKAQSATVKNNHNPEWNFKATFDVDQNTKEGINIAVLDDDFGKDDSLGSTILEISKVQEHNNLLNQWIPLEKCKSGELLLSAEFVPLAIVQQQREVEPLVLAAPIKESVQEVGLEPKEIKNETIPQEKRTELIVETTPVPIEENIQVDFKPKEKTKEKAPQVETTKPVDETTLISVSPAVKPLEAGQVIITVYKAKDIEKKGKFGKADPYVKMTLGKQKAKSATVKNNHNPEWNFKATFDVDQNTKEGINIAVFDEDFGKDDSLGSTILDISKVQEHTKLLNHWIPLEKCESGEILLSTEFIPRAKVQEQKQIEEDVVKSEFSNQEIGKKYVQQEDVIQEDVKKQNKSETGAKGLKDMFKKEKNISSDTVQHH